jgi:hypothetical protein
MKHTMNFEIPKLNKAVQETDEQIKERLRYGHDTCR